MKLQRGMPLTGALPWPLIAIDFEASSLDSGTYPIEVGLCRWQSADHPLEIWSTLIAPIPAWREHGSWWPSSQQVHGIRPEELDHGMSPTEAVARINAIANSSTAYCDGGNHDVHWAQMLVRASGVCATWQLGDFDALPGQLHQAGYRRMVEWLDRSPPRHRAGDDAELLMKAFAKGLSIEYGEPVPITFEKADFA